MYQYHATIIRILDGDSCEINIDLGLKIFFKTVCRLGGINAPELNSADERVRIKAIEAKLFLSDLLPLGSIVIIDSKKLDMYGRPIVVIWYNLINVNELMLASGNAVVYK